MIGVPMLSYWNTLRQFNRNVLLYLLATALIGFAVDGGVYSVLFNLYLLRLGYGAEFIGQVNAVGLLAFALGSLPAGALGGRYGSRPVLLWGLGMTIAGVWLVPLSEVISPGYIAPLLIFSYITLFLGLALYFVNAVPFVMDITTLSERSHAFSLQSALLALAAFTGSMLGGFLPGWFGQLLHTGQEHPEPYRLPLLFAAVVVTPALWAILRTDRVTDQELPEERPVVAAPTPGVVSFRPKRRWWQVERRAFGLLMQLATVRFFQVGGMAVAGTFFNVYMDQTLQVETSTIGTIAAIARLIAVPAALLTPVLVLRWGAPRTVVLASTVTLLSMLPLALVPVWGVAGAGMIGVVAASSMRYPAFLAYSMELAPRAWRAAMSGAGETAGGLAFAMMAWLGGIMIAKLGFAPLFLTGAAVTLVGTALFWLWFVWSTPKVAADVAK
jgi:MFS family permease